MRKFSARATSHGGRRKKKGQALVEFALVGVFLALLLAAAVDLGRVFYTGVIVVNMAGEGAAYAALYAAVAHD